MRDLTHPYLGLGSIPIKAGPFHLATAASLRESQEQERIRAEILRLGAVNGPPPDWRVVVECAVVVLRDQRKDLQVACYLCWGLWEREGYTGLSVGLSIIRDMVALYWEHIHPPLDRQKARLASLDWLAENLSTHLERTRPKPEDHTALEKGLSVFIDLEDIMRSQFATKAPPFGHARRQLAEYLGQLPGPAPTAHMAYTAADQPSSPPMAHHSMVPDPPADRGLDRQAAPIEQAPTMVKPNTANPSSAPSRPPRAGRILTPAERAVRRMRWILAASLSMVFLALALGAAAYWYHEIKTPQLIAFDLLSDTAPQRAVGQQRLSDLDQRQRALLLSTYQSALQDHYSALALKAADHYEMAKAEVLMHQVLTLYPDSSRLKQVNEDIAQRGADIGTDVGRRRAKTWEQITTRVMMILPKEKANQVIKSLSQMIDFIAEGKLLHARETLNSVAAGVPANDTILFEAIPNLAAYAVIELSEKEATQQHFTRSIQLLTDGVVFLPDNQILQAARKRQIIRRSEYLLQKTLEDPYTLNSILVQQAVDQLRNDIPVRYQVIIDDLLPSLKAKIDEIRTKDPKGAELLDKALHAMS